MPKLTLQSQADLTVPLSAEQLEPCSRHRDCSYSVDIKPECKNFTCVAVSLQEITSQTLDNTVAQRLHPTGHHPSLPHHPRPAFQCRVPHILPDECSYSHYVRKVNILKLVITPRFSVYLYTKILFFLTHIGNAIPRY